MNESHLIGPISHSAALIEDDDENINLRNPYPKKPIH